MLTRRHFLTLSAAGAALLVLPPLPAFAALSPEQATQFVQQTATQIVGIINGSSGDAEKKRAISPIVDAAVDVNGVGRFCLGTFWRTASPQQQQEYLQLFHSVLINSVTGRLGDYRGVSIQIGRTEQRADGIYIASVLNRPGTSPAAVTWVVGEVGGQPKVIDVIAEGTSLRVTQRSDYASYLHQHGDNVAALITALRQQLAQK